MLLIETPKKEKVIVTPNKMNKNGDYFFVANGGQYHKLHVEDILWVSSEGNYAHIHKKHKSYVVRISLTNLLKLLPSEMFTKVQKGYLVQIGAIDFIDRTNSELVIGETKIPIGRSYKAELFRQLNLIG